MLFKMDIVICKISRPLETLNVTSMEKDLKYFKGKWNMEIKREVTVNIHWELGQYLIWCKTVIQG